TEVHVFQGKVELHQPAANKKAAAPTELTMGKGIRLDAGRESAITSDPKAFRTAEELARRLERQAQRRHQDWLAASDTIRRDDSLLVYFPFQSDLPMPRTLPNQAQGRKEPHDGAIVGCSWVTGRWPGKRGLEFKSVSDRVRFNVPGTFSSVTLAA